MELLAHSFLMYTNPNSYMKQLVVFIFFILLITGCNKSTPCEKEIYLIPEGFWGTMVIYFDQPDGEEIQYENDARLYRIPNSGYLKTKFSKNGGCKNNDRINFYYEDSLGVREPVDYFLNLEKDSIPQDRDFVLFTLFSDKSAETDFAIHLMGSFYQFNELMESVHTLEPIKILESLD